MKNFFTVDLEEWHCEKIFPGFNPDKCNDLVIDSTLPLLKLLDKYNVKATFFVLGTVIEKYPFLIKEIDKKGHEIASHGYSHTPIIKLTKESFEKEIIKCKKLTYKAIKKYPVGFRAPSFTLSNETKWILPILKKHGFKYDSSIFPFKSRYYGVEYASKIPYKISFDDVRVESDCGITEYPIQIIRILGIPFIITGGFYFRLYPIWFIKIAISYLNIKNVPINLFIHPWELHRDLPKTGMNWFGRFITYYGLGKVKKLEALIKKHKFGCIYS